MKKISELIESIKKTNISGSSYASTYLRGPSVDSLSSKKSEYESEINQLKRGIITRKEINKINNLKSKERAIDRLIKFKKERERLGIE